MTPPQLRQAPLELLRSQNYPMAPQTMVPALQQAAAGDYRTVHWLPARMGQQQWKKQSTGFYSHPGAMAQAFVPVQAAMNSYFGTIGSSVVTTRRNPSPFPQSMWYDRSRELQQTMDLSYREVQMHPFQRYPLGRDIPRPMTLPTEAFDAMDDFEMFAASRWQTEQRNARIRAMHRIRQLHNEYARYSRP